MPLSESPLLLLLTVHSLSIAQFSLPLFMKAPVPCLSHGMRAFFSCLAWRVITSPLSKVKRRLDSFEATQGAPRYQCLDSGGERQREEVILFRVGIAFLTVFSSPAPDCSLYFVFFLPWWNIQNQSSLWFYYVFFFFSMVKRALNFNNGDKG